jgi:WD40 repeat protein
MAFSQDGTRLAVGGGDGTVAILEFPKMTRVATLMGHPAGIIYVAFSNDASRLVSIDSSWNLKLWNLATTKELKAFTFPTDLHSYSLSPGGQPASLWLATSDNNGTGFVLRDLAADPVTVINASAAMEVYAVAFSPDGQQLAVDTADGRMTLWDVSNKMKPVEGPALWAAPPATGNVLIATEAVFSTDGRFVAASGSLGYTAPGDIKMAQTVPPGLKASVVTDSAAMSIDWSRDGKAIATGSWRCGKVTFCRD